METSIKVQPHSHIRVELYCAPCDYRTTTDIPLGFVGADTHTFVDCSKCNRRYVTSLAAINKLDVKLVSATTSQLIPEDKHIHFKCPNCEFSYGDIHITAEQMSKHIPVTGTFKSCKKKYKVQAEQTATIAVWEE